VADKTEAKSQDLAPTLIGAGSATGLLGLAQFIPDATIKAIVTFLAPTATVVIAMLWAFGTTSLRNLLESRTLNQALKEARDIRAAVEADPTASEDHKQQARDAVEKLEALALVLIRRRIASVGIEVT